MKRKKLNKRFITFLYFSAIWVRASSFNHFTYKTNVSLRFHSACLYVNLYFAYRKTHAKLLILAYKYHHIKHSTWEINHHFVNSVLKGGICHFVKWQIPPPSNTKVTMLLCLMRSNALFVVHTAITALFQSKQLLLFVFKMQQDSLLPSSTGILTAMQRQTAVTAYFSSKQLLLFARRHI